MFHVWKSNKGDMLVSEMPNGHIKNCLKNLNMYGMKDPVTFERSSILAAEWIKIFTEEFSRRETITLEEEEVELEMKSSAQRRSEARKKKETEYWDSFGEAGWHINELAGQIKLLKLEIKILKKRLNNEY